MIGGTGLSTEHEIIASVECDEQVVEVFETCLENVGNLAREVQEVQSSTSWADCKRRRDTS